MTYTDRIVTEGKCRLTLPYFLSDTSDTSVERVINLFYRALEKEIISYANSDASHVRLYTSEYRVEDINCDTKITLHLCVRKHDGGKVTVAKRDVICHWHLSKLVKLYSVDL